MKKKLISVLILAALFVCLLPASAFAEAAIGDLLPGNYMCIECDNYVKVRLLGYEEGRSVAVGTYFHAAHIECVKGHKFDLDFRCFNERDGIFPVTYEQLSAESDHDPAVYHKAICVCGHYEFRGHNYGELVDGSRTCSDCGYVQTCDHTPLCEDFVCPVCNETVKGAGHDTELEHDFDNHWARCTKCGNIIGSAEAHKWDEGVITQEPTCMISGIKKFTCTVCGAIDQHDIEGDHDYKDSHDADNHYQECSVCHDKINVEAHKWDDGVITQEPTCMISGIKKFTCTVCGAVDQRDIAGDHDYKDAHDENEHYQECSVCHDKINREAHKWDDGVVTQEPNCLVSGIKKFTCTVCGAVDQRDIVGDHDYKDAHDENEHYQECTVCHDKINAEAHKFEWKIDKAATTSAEGKKHEECSVCGYAKDPVTVPKLAPDAKPKTGDSSAVWFILLISSAGAAAIVLRGKRKLS